MREQQSSTSDAAADSGQRQDVAADVGVQLCDPAAQNCASGLECDFACEGTAATVACRSDNGSTPIGAPCLASMPCAKGSACVATSTGGVACRRYCAGDGDCTTGERCHNDNVAVACGAPATTLLLHLCY